MKWEKNRNVKSFLIGNLLEAHAVKIDKDKYEKLMKDNGVEDWQEVLWNKNELTEIKEYATKIVNIIWNGGSYPDYPLSATSRVKYNDALLKDQQEEQELTDFKNKKDQLQSLVHDYEKRLKAVIGNDDLTNWKSKITKVGTNDKDITDLRNKITDLQTTKSNLDKELKEKSQQILDHRCDTPNNTELNQTKEELDKANKEITSLKEQLDKPNNPSPNQPNQEEERKEEQENSNLTLEQLKAKLNKKREKIKTLKEQLSKKQKNSNHSIQSNSSNGSAKLPLGIAIGILIVATFKGLTLLLQKKKKKQ